MKRALSLGIVSSVLCLSVVAHADPAFTAEKPQIGLGLDYGIWTGDDIGDFNPYGIGISVLGGYTLPMGVYIGGNFDYFLGDSEGDSKLNIYGFDVEGGYDIGVAPNLVVRPQLGIGYTTFHNEICIEDVPGLFEGGCVDASDSKFSLAPGARLLMDFDAVFGHAGVRYKHIFVDEGNADGLLLTVGAGLKF